MREHLPPVGDRDHTARFRERSRQNPPIGLVGLVDNLNGPTFYRNTWRFFSMRLKNSVARRGMIIRQNQFDAHIGVRRVAAPVLWEAVPNTTFATMDWGSVEADALSLITDVFHTRPCECDTCVTARAARDE